MPLGHDHPASPCRLCGTASRRLVADRGRGGTPLETVLCTGCGLVSHAEIPSETDVNDFYATRYRLEYKGGFTPKRKHALRALRGAMARARRLAPLLPTHARVLDIGASSGEFTFVMREAGFAATGLEPNWGYAEFARREYQVEIGQGGWDSPDFPREALHLVTMNHVMEHLVDPWAAMRRIHGALAPEGLLFVEVPNLAGIRKQLANTFHAAHIWNFTPATLIAAAWQAGFTPRAGENLAHTSIVFRKRVPQDHPPAGADATHAEALWRQMTGAQSRSAYLLSAAPITRRWQRLLRNIGEHVTTRRHPTIRAMGEALLDQAALEPGSPWAGRHGWRMGARRQPANSAASRAKA
jgi:2-polyprenyl-3-methyl-5-hydroxy-6-metoxy-1,4-benzoquinol methylase